MIRSRTSRAARSKLLALVVAGLAVAPSRADASPEGAPTHRLHTMPTRFPGEAPRAPLASCQLTYHGGPVISKPEIVAVYWGSVTSSVQSAVPGLMNAIVATPYMDALSEYNTAGQSNGTNQKIVRGAFVSGVPITPSNGSTNLQDSDVTTELVAQLQAKKLPAPTFDAEGYAETMYVIYFAPGITISDQGASTCQQGGFCAYHSDTTFGGKSIPYAVIPDFDGACAQGCGGSPSAGLGIATSHEIAEAVTDEGVGSNTIAWADDNCQAEIGDLCSPGGQGTGAGTGVIDGFTLSKEWSNQHQTCELTNPSIGPQGGCATNADCSAPTPVCDTTKQTCVGCLTNADCSGATPTCDASTRTCRACAGDTDCTDPQSPRCDVGSGACVPAPGGAPDAGSGGSGSGGNGGGNGSGGGNGGGGNGSGGNGSGGGNGDGSGSSSGSGGFHGGQGNTNVIGNGQPSSGDNGGASTGSSGCAVGGGDDPRGALGAVAIVLAFAASRRGRRQRRSA